jgi:long-chain acyl-CoA synthetase
VEKKLGVNLYSFEDIEKMGEKNGAKPVPPKPADLAMIMYTSGTTGPPKGVMLTHRNITVSAYNLVLTGEGVVDENDVYLSYLPLAHILAFAFEVATYAMGMSIGYGSPRSISDVMVRNCRGDIAELRPTFFLGVPTIFERMKQGITDKLNAAGGLKKSVFKMAYSGKKKNMQKGRPSPTWDKIVFKKLFIDAFGGRLKFFVSGGAPLSAEVQQFLSVCFGVPFLEGYGLTETCGAIARKDPSNYWSFNNVGSPFGCLEVRLVDVPEMNYLSSQDPPRGEIWARGHNISSGYYKNPQKTAEDFDLKEHWFKTGDVGQWNPNGSLSIIDRKKNLVKPPHGEYIAVERLESHYKTSMFVSNIYVHADPKHNEIIAFVYPNKKHSEDWAKSSGVKYDDWASLCDTRKLRDAILEDLAKVHKKEGLRSMERVEEVVLFHEEWTAENGWLTTALKLRRFDVKVKQKDLIESTYKELEKKGKKKK